MIKFTGCQIYSSWCVCCFCGENMYHYDYILQKALTAIFSCYNNRDIRADK